MGSLISKFPFLTNIDLNCCVREFVNSDGSWNLDMFRGWLLDDVICRITSIPPPHLESESDRVFWARSTLGAFLIRSACWPLKETTWNSRNKA